MSEPTVAPTKKQRIISVDVFRGFTIFLMLFVNCVAGYRNLPFVFPQVGSAPVSTFKHASNDTDTKAWAIYEGKETSENFRLGKVTAYDKATNKYDVAVMGTDGKTTDTAFALTSVAIVAPKPVRKNADVIVKLDKSEPGKAASIQASGNGCTATDWVAPFFVFIVGVCIPISWVGRKDKWWGHVFNRTFLLIFVGMLYMSTGRNGLSYWWGILQAIGVAYFVGAVAVIVPWRPRIALIFALGLAHIILVRYFPAWTYIGNPNATAFGMKNLSGDLLRPLNLHCTPWGSLGYGLCTMVGTVLGEAIMTKEMKHIVRASLALGVGFIVAGMAIAVVQPMSKEVVSTAYAFYTSGLAALCFLAFYLVIDVCKISFWIPIFSVFGANALLAFCLQPLVRIPFEAFGLWSFFGGRAGWEGIFIGLYFTMFLWLITLYCNRRGWYWKF